MTYKVYLIKYIDVIYYDKYFAYSNSYKLEPNLIFSFLVFVVWTIIDKL